MESPSGARSNCSPLAKGIELEPLALNVSAIWRPDSLTTSFTGELRVFRLPSTDAYWPIVYRRAREYVWSTGQDVSLRIDLLKVAEKFSQEVGWESPF